MLYFTKFINYTYNNETLTTYINGKQHGYMIGYYDNGNIDYIHQYINGKQHGYMIGYYKNGNICYNQQYINGILVK